MQQPEPLVSREGLEQLVDGIKELAPYQDYMKQRWIGMILWWNSRSVAARTKYMRLRAIVVGGGVSIPVLTTLSMLPNLGTAMTILTAAVGAGVAGAAAWEGVANYGDIWREKRRAAELLKVEGWQFAKLVGPYQEDKDHATAFPRFAGAVEAMIAKEIGEYLTVFDGSVAQARAASDTLLKTVLEEAKKRLSTS